MNLLVRMIESFFEHIELVKQIARIDPAVAAICSTYLLADTQVR